MRKLSDTIERLTRLRAGAPFTSSVSNRLTRLSGLLQNPGDLNALYWVPARPASAPALVVVLHGCTQTASGYDAGTGWSQLAAEHGFAVLFPEQTRQNNPNLCFNWFHRADTVRDGGEVASIREMIRVMVDDHGVDAERIYITGLSAGGAMANAMLATYPEVFAGGAVIAGLPYGVASTVPEAFDRMRGHGLPDPPALRENLLDASMHAGVWPSLSIWQGTADTTVVEANAHAVVEQWRGVHAARSTPDVMDRVQGHRHQVWKDRSGRSAIELFLIEGMSHGTPLDVATGYGKAAPFLLDVGVSSTLQIASTWGLIPANPKKASTTDIARATTPPREDGGQHPSGVQEIIEGALRKAGLMK